MKVVTYSEVQGSLHHMIMYYYVYYGVGFIDITAHRAHMGGGACITGILLCILWGGVRLSVRVGVRGEGYDGHMTIYGYNAWSYDHIWV